MTGSPKDWATPHRTRGSILMLITCPHTTRQRHNRHPIVHALIVENNCCCQMWW